MQWIFPIAGNGTRLQHRGLFKPFIMVSGRAIIEWCLRGIREHFSINDTIIFIMTKSQYDQHEAEVVLKKVLENLSLTVPYRILTAPHTPNGPAVSVSYAFQLLNENEPCLVINADQFTYFEIRHELNQFDCFIPIYYSMSPKSSFVVIENGEIQSIREKEVVSYYATAGIYGFGSGKSLIYAINHELLLSPSNREECYMSHVIMHLLTQGGKIFPTCATTKFDLGDELSLVYFENFASCFD